MAQMVTSPRDVENVAAIHTPVLQNHHSKTLDIGLNGYTLSAGPLGDVSFVDLCLAMTLLINPDTSIELLPSTPWNGSGQSRCTIRWQALS
jgi:hypothetical protein